MQPGWGSLGSAQSQGQAIDQDDLRQLDVRSRAANRGMADQTRLGRALRFMRTRPNNGNASAERNAFGFSGRPEYLRPSAGQFEVTYSFAAPSACIQLGLPVLEVVGMPIRQVIGSLAFEPADVEAMERALEAACVVLRLSKREDSLRQIVARKVIEIAATGERDPEVLCQRVVSELEREALEVCGDSNSADVA